MGRAQRTMGKFFSTLFSFALLAVFASLLSGNGAVAEGVVPDSARQVQLSLAAVVRTAAPAVVSIFTKDGRRSRGYERGDDRGYDQGFDRDERGYDRGSQDDYGYEPQQQR